MAPNPSLADTSQAPAPSPNRIATLRSNGSRRAMVDIFSAATTSTVPKRSANPFASASANNPPALASGRSQAGIWPQPNRVATLDAGPGKRSSADPELTMTIPRSDACTPPRRRQSSAAATAISTTPSPAAAKRRSSMPHAPRIHSGVQSSRCPSSRLPTLRSGRYLPNAFRKANAPPPRLSPAVQVALDPRDGFELLGTEGGIRYRDVEFFLDGAHQVRQRERVEQSGIEQRFLHFGSRVFIGCRPDQAGQYRLPFVHRCLD